MVDVTEGVIAYTPMRRENLDSVLAIERSIYPFPWTRGNFEDSLAADYVARLMWNETQQVGYAVMMRVVDEVHLLNITIVAERQQAGFGTLLLRSLIDEARGCEASRMILEVRQSNLGGRAFYKRHGFSQIGERADYYPAKQGRETALVLEKQL